MPPIKSECFPLKFTPRGDKMAQVRGVGVFWILTPSAFVCRVGAEGPPSLQVHSLHPSWSQAL